jgi:hypothetical protein
MIVYGHLDLTGKKYHRLTNRIVPGFITWRKKMKAAVLNILARIAPFGLLKFFLPKQFILYGHLITDKKHLVQETYRYPSFREFDELLMLLRKAGYEFVEMTDFLKRDGRKKILFTLDDGFKIIAEEHARMKDRNVPYVLFVTTKPLEYPRIYIPLFNKKIHCRNV